jgi:arylsulfatase
MHVYTHVVQKYRERAAKWSAEDDLFAAGMMELDDVVGTLLTELDQLGVSKNTIVIFTSDNGPMSSWWPDGGTTPFKGEKSSSWEGAYRVPTLIRWPARIPAGTISNGLQSHMDLFSTLAAAAGVSDVGSQLLGSHKVKIDGINNLAHWTDPTGKTDSARESYVYYVENSIIGVRWKHWKSVARARDGFFDAPKQSYYLFNLRMDPFEKHLGHKNNELAMRKAWVGSMLREVVEEHIKSLREFPPRQASNSLTAGFEKTR